MTPVIEFLFRLRELSYPFVLVMATIASGGSVLAVVSVRRFGRRLTKAVRNYESNVHDCQQKFDPEDYLRLQAFPTSSLRILDAIPAVLVTIGILGTFLGLGIAVGRATESLRNPETSIVALQDLLKVVSFKFQASAWGVLLSVLFSVAVRMPVEAFAENRLTDSAKALLAKRGTFGTGIADAVRSAVSESIGSAVEDMRRAALELAAGASAFSNEARAATVELKRAAESLGDLKDKLSASLSEIAPAVSKSMSGPIEKMSNGVTQSLQHGIEKLEKSAARQVESADRSAASSKAASEAMQRQLAELDKVFKTSLDQLNKHQAESKSSLQELAKTLNKFEVAQSEVVKLMHRLDGDQAKAKLAAPPPSRSSSGTPQAPRRTKAPADDDQVEF